ncbi:hypothetical protein IKF15_01465 [Candidatus Saccharibacteria bacterium]|nr:hypothetical protein [Candidatus Saccharibacteria bacterium]
MEKTTEKTVKGKVILFIIGVLIGAIISTASLLVYIKTLGANTSSCSDSSMQAPGGTPPEMPSGDNSQGGTPPEQPSDDGSSSENNS